MVKKKHLFTKNLEVHNHDSRSANTFHLPIANLTKLKGTHYAEIKILNHLPTHIKSVANEIHVFKKALRGFFLITHIILLMNILSLINNIYSRL